MELLVLQGVSQMGINENIQLLIDTLTRHTTKTSCSFNKHKEAAYTHAYLRIAFPVI